MIRRTNKVFAAAVAGLGLTALVGGVTTLKTQWPAECNVHTVGRALSNVTTGSHYGSDEDVVTSASWSLVRCDDDVKSAILRLPGAAKKIAGLHEERVIEAIAGFDRDTQSAILDREDVVEHISSEKDAVDALLDVLDAYPLPDQARYLARASFYRISDEQAARVIGMIDGMTQTEKAAVLSEQADKLVSSGQMDAVLTMVRELPQEGQAHLMLSYGFIREMVQIGEAGYVLDMLGALDKDELGRVLWLMDIDSLAEAGYAEQIVELLRTTPREGQKLFFESKRRVELLEESGQGAALQEIERSWTQPRPAAPPALRP